MRFMRRFGTRRDVVRKGPVAAVEVLEGRALLASSAFDATALTPLIHADIRAADDGADTSLRAIHQTVTALETQLRSGPLAGLTAGTLTASQFQDEVSSLVTSYDTEVDTLYLPRFRNIDAILKLQGAKVVADVQALAALQTADQATSAQFNTASGTAVGSLTSGPLQPLHTDRAGYVSVTQTFVTGLNTLETNLGTAATTPLAVGDLTTVVNAEAAAYRANLAASLYRHPYVLQQANAALTSLTTSAAAISASTDTATVAQAQFKDAVTALNAALLGPTGVFGPHGALVRASE